MMEAGKALTIDFFQLIPAACRVFVGKAIGKGNPAVFVRRVCILHIGGAVWTINSGFEIVKLEFPYNASENSQPSAEGIETGPGKKEGIVNKPP